MIKQPGEVIAAYLRIGSDEIEADQPLARVQALAVAQHIFNLLGLQFVAPRQLRLQPTRKYAALDNPDSQSIEVEQRGLQKGCAQINC